MTTLPLSYVWSATDQTPVPHSSISNLNDSISFTWTAPGVKTITVTATNTAGSVTKTRSITIKAPPTAVTLSGPPSGPVNTSYNFTASVSAVLATTPLSYTWQATDQAPVTHSANLSDALSFTWITTGTKAITVTATNGAGTPVATTHQVLIIAQGAGQRLYLPVIVKNSQ